MPSDNELKVVVAGLPSRPVSQEPAVRDQGRGVSGPPAGLFDPEVHAGHLLCRVDHLPHGKPVTIPAVHTIAPARISQVIECAKVGFGQVLDVYVVPDTRTVRRRIVRSVDQKVFGFTPRRLERPGDQVSGLLVCLPYPAAGVCARHVKIAPRRHT